MSGEDAAVISIDGETVSVTRSTIILIPAVIRAPHTRRSGLICLISNFSERVDRTARTADELGAVEIAAAGFFDHRRSAVAARARHRHVLPKEGDRLGRRTRQRKGAARA